MLVPFAVDASAFGADTSDDSIAAHARLIDIWRHVGVLVHGGDRFEECELRDAVERLPQRTRTLWQKALRYQRVSGAGAQWEPLSSYHSQSDCLRRRGCFEVGCFEDRRAASLLIPRGELSVLVGGSGPEICRFSLADRASKFQSALEAAMRPIEPGEDTATLWRRRFLPVVRACRQGIVLIDRYAVIEHIECREPPSGLCRLLVELDKTLNRQRVTLMVATNRLYDERAIEAQVRLLADRLSGRGVRELELFTGSHSYFGRHAHDRSLRVGNTVLELNTGVSVLSGMRTHARSGFSLKPRSDEYDRHELFLRSQLKLTPTIACGRTGLTPPSVQPMGSAAERPREGPGRHTFAR